MKLEEVQALFLLAGFEATKFFQIENGYWPEAYTELRKSHPWWLVKTEFGLIRIGWRKRVISINWEDTKFRGEITVDNVTRDQDMVHAWTVPKALEYLTALRYNLKVKHGST